MLFSVGQALSVSPADPRSAAATCTRKANGMTIYEAE
jgi:hypothetical protein